MALKATVFKAQLSVSDLDRNHYHTYTLTLARHPSETDERMMLRLLAFALFAGEQLEFTRGLSSVDEPDLWARDLAGNICLWIELGQPDEKRVRKACGQAESVALLCYGGASTDIWWRQNTRKFAELSRLRVYSVIPDQARALVALVHKSMKLHCTIQGGQVLLGDEAHSFNLDIEQRQ